MSTINALEHKGKVSEFPAVELLRQIAETKMSGTFRFSRERQKIAVYLDAGTVIFAASNIREHHLAFQMVQCQALKPDELNNQMLADAEFEVKLLAHNRLTDETLQKCRNRQVGEIVGEVLLWTSGEWSFNPLTRVRENLHSSVNLPDLLIKAARALPPEFVHNRFADELDAVMNNHLQTLDFNLTPEEAFILSRVEASVIGAEQLADLCGLSIERIRLAVYALWLGGLLRRFNYKTAFNENAVQRILSAKITLSQPPPKEEIKAAAPPELTSEPALPDNLPLAADLPVDENAAVTAPEYVEDFLNRVESAQTHYEVLNLSSITSAVEIKQNYLRLAKLFHPDKFYQTGGETFKRVQNAFTRLAQSYETLKDAKSRELYDYKLQKQTADGGKSEIVQFTHTEVYDKGLAALQAGDYNQAVALLTRAKQLAPEIAAYRARLGQSLSINPKFRHQAEAEMQTAVRLDADNPEWRLLLAEYYVTVGLGKRAAGELNRLLAIHPHHAAARQMLLNLR